MIAVAATTGTITTAIDPGAEDSSHCSYASKGRQDARRRRHEEFNSFSWRLGVLAFLAFWRFKSAGHEAAEARLGCHTALIARRWLSPGLAL
jgi:hypothetical protein